MLVLYENFLDTQFDEHEYLKYGGMDIDNKHYTISKDRKYFLEKQKIHGSTNVIHIPELNFLIDIKYGSSKNLIIICEEDDINYVNIENLLKHQGLIKRFDEIFHIKEEELELHLFEKYSSKRSLILASGIQLETSSLIISSRLSFCIFQDIDMKYKNELLDNYVYTTNNDNVVNYNKFKKCFETAYNKKSSLLEILDKIKYSMEIKVKHFQDIYSYNHENVDINLFDDSISFFYKIRDQSDSLHKTVFYDKFVKNLNYSDTGIFLDHEVCHSFLVEERCYLYPWIGILEVVDDEDVSYLLNSERFILSVEFCIVLFVLTDNIMNIIHSSIDLDIRVLNIFNISHRERRFNLENFKSNPLVINTGRKINMEMLKIFNTKKKSILKEKSITEETFLDSITVISSTHPSPVGIFYDCIFLGKPVVLRNNDFFENILGNDYPLFLDNCHKEAVLEILTEDNILTAYNKINNILDNINYDSKYSIENIIFNSIDISTMSCEVF